MDRRVTWLGLLIAVVAVNGVALARAATMRSPGTGWRLLAPPFPLQNLVSISCPAAANCYVVGQSSVVITHDGGASWRFVRLHSQHLTSISCPTATSCLAFANWFRRHQAYENGFATGDGGKTWRQTVRNVSIHGLQLFDLACPSTTICYAIGEGTLGEAGTVVRSDSGGARWTPLHVAAGLISQLACPSIGECVVAGPLIKGQASLMITHDGGKTWTSHTLPGAANGFGVTALSCPRTDDCYAGIGKGSVLHTRNGWRTWTAVRNGDPGGRWLIGLACPADNRCVSMTSSFGVLVYDGTSWQSIRIPYPYTPRALACPIPATCVLAGAPSQILVTQDGGITWRSPLSPTTNSFTSISCPSAGACTAVGVGGTIEGTTDGGATWHLEKSGIPGTLDGVACPSTSICFAVGGSWGVQAQSPMGDGQPVILATHDGGSTWNSLAPASMAGKRLSLGAIACPTTTTCYAGSDSGEVLQTVDGGHSWTWHGTGRHFQLNGMACTSAQSCFAVGGLDADCPDSCQSPEEGVVFATHNGGGSWRRVLYRRVPFDRPVTIGAHLFAVACPSTTVCYAAGHGILARTTDAGYTWKVSPAAASGAVSGSTALPPPPITGLACATSDTCFVGLVPGLLETTDGGRSWHDGGLILPKNYPLLAAALACPAPATCFAAGTFGMIFKWSGKKSAHQRATSR